MKKIEFPMISFGESNLDDIVNELQSIKNNDINYYYDFLGHRLYSDTVTLDSAYKEIYKLSRQEYREKLQEIYKIYKAKEKENLEKLKKDMLGKKARIYEQAKKIISEEQMPIFDEILDILIPHGIYISSDKNVYLFLELLEQLNNDNYSLESAKELYNNIKSRHVLANCRLLRTIKQLSVHGDVLFNELYDEESELRAKEALEHRRNKQIPTLKLDSFFRDQTEDEILTNYDRDITTKRLFCYSFIKK